MRKRKAWLWGGLAAGIVAIVAATIILPASRRTVSPFPFLKDEPVFHGSDVVLGTRMDAWAYAVRTKSDYKGVASTYRPELMKLGYIPVWRSDRVIFRSPTENLVVFENGRGKDMGNPESVDGWVTIRVNIERPATVIDQMDAWLRTRTTP